MSGFVEYTWIVVFGAFAAFFAAFGIGANDVANAYATSVGSKALTIKQACFLAVIFEFLGAVLAGSAVAETIRKGTADYECFDGSYMDRAILMYGNLCVIGAVGMWLLVATKFEMPVSTTHSCVGGLVGMTIAAKGADCVVWYKEIDIDSGKYLPGGIVGIVLSWVFSPLLSGIVAVLLFLSIRTFVLRSAQPFIRSIRAYPFLVWGAVTINSFFIISKGVSKKICPSKYNIWICQGWDASLPNGAEVTKAIAPGKVNAGIAFGLSAGFGVVAAIALIPLYKYIHRTTLDTFSKPKQIENKAENIEKPKNILAKTARKLFDRDIHAITVTDEKVSVIHNNAEQFDEKAEYVFKYIQIFSAIFDSFAHGANDVANAMGPFMTIWVIWKAEGEAIGGSKTDIGDDSYWILAIGGIGIGIGLLLYGYKIMQEIGVKLAVITPSRGVCIELGSAVVIITGSYMGIPLSTTHAQVGATVGVALLEGKKGINTKVLSKAGFGWIVTLIVAGLLAGLLTSQGIYSPINEYAFNSAIVFNETS
ncbi:putative phosphate permease [Emiliania huxleyi virus 86]|uniref:Putative phosphate permease n=2 Tax=Emiliania huxleyi virus 86 TaxID=181082 RepID=Q4A316_EHV8U|nr:putative phosphate permease [Emiliania huxleyi virus 86]AEO97646.1 sodium/phosphate symporter [Emiliania huxleyi virus 84]AEP15056.1 phosphate permease [Emiliania huxleyi virus 88]AHA54698.1 putative phosphate permease [Emiliania huxleyi virus 145]AHA55727.1 putative phosphate permease [Emiliania huxleyi virus 164]CAI65540.1 putative phosphate permease [Emiliania huxleyi virus 86]